MTAQEQLKREILATAFRYSQESEITILETIEAMHDAAEDIARAALNAKEGEE